MGLVAVNDFVLVELIVEDKPSETEGGIIIPDGVDWCNEPLAKGRVLSVGPIVTEGFEEGDIVVFDQYEGGVESAGGNLLFIKGDEIRGVYIPDTDAV